MPLHFPLITKQMFTSTARSFPPVDDLVSHLQQVNYQKLYKDFLSFMITMAAVVAAVSTILWEKIQVMKFQTPQQFHQFFYFSVNMIGEPGDEIVGLSVGNRYIGLYNSGISWGVLDENGAL